MLKDIELNSEIERLLEKHKREENRIEKEIQRRNEILLENIKNISKILEDSFPQSESQKPIHYTKIACEIADKVTFTKLY